jgi:hypothetical protein
MDTMYSTSIKMLFVAPKSIATTKSRRVASGDIHQKPTAKLITFLMCWIVDRLIWCITLVVQKKV